MKCIQVGTPVSLETLQLIERDPPRPGPGELLIRIRASSLNFHDYLVVKGVLRTAPGRVPLSDGVGEVVETGPGTSAFHTGDRVLATFFPDWPDGLPTEASTARMRGDHVDGFASEYVVLREIDCTTVPANLTDLEAATLPCAALTAWRALVVEGNIKPGDSVLVEGTGGVSIFALQLAKLAGAKVIGTTSSEVKAERLKALGADQVINYLSTPKWHKAVREFTGGAGVDHVVEVVGGDLAQALQACRVGGRLCLVGALSRQPIQFSALLAIRGNVRISGVTVGNRQHQLEMLSAIRAGGLKPVIDRVFPLTALREAFVHQEAHAHFGKISIQI
jgi:NADPH:quinone reductase-like Zn-dependent oxidoreductase